jgi:hypothetical protein
MQPIDSKAGEGTREARLRAVRRALREGDPAPEPPAPGDEGEAGAYAPLSREEIVVMRATMLGSVPEERRVSPRLLPIVVGSALTLAGWGVVSLLTWLDRLPAPAGESAPRVATSSIPAETPGSISGEGRPGEGGAASRPLPPPSAGGPIAEPAPPGFGGRAGAGGPSPAEVSMGSGSPRPGSSRSPRALSPRPGGAPSRRPASSAQLSSVGDSVDGSTGGSVPKSAPNADAVVAPALRELQFSTPGGTRIVWVFASGDAPISETPRPARL